MNSHRNWARQALQSIQPILPGRLKDLVIAFLSWRMLLYLGAYVGSIIAAKNPDFAFPNPLSSKWEFLFGSWVHWDAAWYLSIIERGYSYSGPGVQANVAFFPLYPLVVRAASCLLGWMGDSRRVAIASGIVISNLFALLALVMLYRLTKYELDRLGNEHSEHLAFRAALYFIFFPTSVFFSSLYAEGLFLFLLIASFYCLRRGKLLLGGIFGGAASLCRINGLILLVPFALEYYQRWRFRLRKEALSLLLIPFGIAFYCCFLYVRFGEPLAFLRVQSAPGWHGTIPVFPFFRSLKNTYSFLLFDRGNVWRFLEIVYSLGALSLAILTLKRLPLSYGLYAVVACLVPLASDTWSMQRYVLGAFPIFMTLGLLSRDEKALLLLVLFAFMLGISTVMWINGLWLG